MKITVQPDLPMLPVIFPAWLIKRAWRPTWASPISPSISARGTSAASQLPRCQRQQSEPVDQQFPERIHQYRVGKSADLQYQLPPQARACSSTKAAMPPCTSATACSATVLPELWAIDFNHSPWVSRHPRSRGVPTEIVSTFMRVARLGA